jgi:hypothetical protein
LNPSKERKGKLLGGFGGKLARVNASFLSTFLKRGPGDFENDFL